eukprot:2379978-Pyramimonas_sp.AAC.1
MSPTPAGSGPGDDLRKLLPAKSNPFMLRMLFGKNISVTTQRRADRCTTAATYPLLGLDTDIKP